MRYTPEIGWLLNTSKYHARITKHEAQKIAYDLMEPVLKKLYDECNDQKLRTTMSKEIRNSKGSWFIKGVEDLGRGWLVDHINFYETDRSVINAQNCVVDLRTGQTLKHDPSFRFTHISNVDFNGNYPDTPVFDQFLRQICCGDSELMEYMLRCLGYSITGETSEQKFFVAYGSGGNGKSTLMNIIREVIGIPSCGSADGTQGAGMYMGSLRAEGLVVNPKGDNDKGDDIARLNKARMVVCSEMGDRKVRDERLKALTGEDTLQVRLLYHEFFDMVPIFKLWLLTNQKPRMRGNDDGLWRRAIMLPFAADFRDNPDDQLLQKLSIEKVGIFSKLVKYATIWYREGLGKPPAVVQEEIEAWKNEVDPISRFLESETTRDENATISNAKLWDSWCRWCDDNNERQESSVAFFTRMRKFGFDGASMREYGKKVRGIQGLKLNVQQGELEDKI
jgi:putative DNA primase/helicase